MWDEDLLDPVVENFLGNEAILLSRHVKEADYLGTSSGDTQPKRDMFPFCGYFDKRTRVLGAGDDLHSWLTRI